jgi:L,D-peptidoglycan transpeptidase YkuD (ErfK/YbiS/YcfS/YnhG family)
VLALLVAALVASPVPPQCRQLVLSTAAGWDATRATLQAYERTAAEVPWKAVGAPIPASLGRSGLAWGRGRHAAGLAGPRKQEGDGRSPAGVFDLRVLTGYDAQPPHGARLPYRQATPTLRCVDEARSRFYNQLVDESQVAKDWSSAEEMRRADELYRFVVWVGHNDDPVVPGGGSCIFLHLRRGADSVTAGCTAFEPEPMQRLLRWLDPQARPALVQLPESEAAARAAAWGLPKPAAQRSAAER